MRRKDGISPRCRWCPPRTYNFHSGRRRYRSGSRPRRRSSWTGNSYIPPGRRMVRIPPDAASPGGIVAAAPYGVEVVLRVGQPARGPGHIICPDKGEDGPQNIIIPIVGTGPIVSNKPTGSEGAFGLIFYISIAQRGDLGKISGLR